ncbi:hypothetical protein [Mycolicibacter heraklionensis]|uniref:hypothetical protein n=1 Tax=Mycolicibacter heraklionensis TaxID=512402 RepID=UPI000AFEFAF4|nr:hypothetical protein [Mycolicibacter heraklionensis]
MGSGSAGMAGSAEATLATPRLPKTSTADDPAATTALAAVARCVLKCVVANSVFRRDMTSPIVGNGLLKTEASLLLVRLK